jgi:hypothetical protein
MDEPLGLLQPYFYAVLLVLVQCIDRKELLGQIIAGHSFCKARISEIYQNSAPGLSEGLIEQILWTFHQSEGLSRHVQTFVKALPSLEPDALTSLLLRPLLHEQVHEFNCLRYFAPSLFVGLYCSIRCLSAGKA